jgi:hypothetical protein
VSLRRTTGKAVGDGELTFGDGIWLGMLSLEHLEGYGRHVGKFGTKVD